MEQDDKRILELVNKLMDADNLEKAPAGFTDSVMSKIDALSESKSTIYKPLISKQIWWLLGISFIALLSFIILKQPATSEGLSKRFELPELSLGFLEDFSLDFSTTLMYAMVFLVIMISVQVPLLKQYFNKSLSF